MGRKMYKAEQLIGKLREAAVLLSPGIDVGEASIKMDARRYKLLTMQGKVQSVKKNLKA